MSAEWMSLLIFVLLLLLLFLGFPIAFTLFSVAAILILVIAGPKGTYSFYAATFHSLTRDIFIAIPLFILMATIFVHSGVGAQMYDTMYKWFAGLRGGLAIGTAVMSALIAAITGLLSTGILTIGYMGFPEMEKRGYNRMISLGIIPAGGGLGPIIPPSITMIIIAAFSQQSVGRMFMGGIFPGLLMAASFIVYILIVCWLRPSWGLAIPLAERATWPEKFRALSGVILPVGIILLILGTIYLGIATPTEAASVGAAGALLSAAINRKLNWDMLKQASLEALKLNGMVMWLVLGGISLGALFVFAGLAPVVKDFMLALPFGPMGVVLVMMAIPLILGMFMDTMVVIVVGLPIFIPIVRDLGFDVLWFCVLFGINITLGAVTPPFGMALFITKGIVPPSIGMGEIYRAVIPYALLMILVLFIGLYWPPLITWLPEQMIGK